MRQLQNDPEKIRSFYQNHRSNMPPDSAVTYGPINNIALLDSHSMLSLVKPRLLNIVNTAPRDLYPRVGFIVTNMSRPAGRVVAFYNKRGTCEQWIKEGKGAIK